MKTEPILELCDRDERNNHNVNCLPVQILTEVKLYKLKKDGCLI